MKKSDFPKDYFWAKKFDEVACITKRNWIKNGHGTLCGKYKVLLGNNYSGQLDEVCPDCIKEFKEHEKENPI